MAPVFLRNLTLDNVVAVLILNGIPPSWVAHGYPYGVQYICERMRENSMESESFREVDAERLRRL